jgi:Zn-finger nucleic acid-binding protein
MRGSRIRPEMAATIGQWVYVWCECHVRIASAITVAFKYQCAGVLLDDFELPRLAENEVKRKERWRQHYRKPGRCIAGLLELESRGKI